MSKVICGDCLEVLKTFEAESFDFCFVDPPYFMQSKQNLSRKWADGTYRKYAGCDDEWDSFKSFDDYKDFTRKYLTEVKRVLKPNGSIVLISGMQSIYEIVSIMREMGFWVLNDIVWVKTNPTPNFMCSRLCNNFETLVWATKSRKAKPTFNYRYGKEINGGKQLTAVWHLPKCSGHERLKDENGVKIHSTQKPLALIERIIKLWTNKGDKVLDIFGGVLTTYVVCEENGRDCVIIEKEQRYIEEGLKRIITPKLIE